MTDSIAARPETVPALHDQNQQRQLLESVLTDACAWHERRGQACRECPKPGRSLCGSCSADQLAMYVFTHLAYRPSLFRSVITPNELVVSKREIIADAAAKAMAYRHGRSSPIDRALCAAYAELAGQLR